MILNVIIYLKKTSTETKKVFNETGGVEWKFCEQFTKVKKSSFECDGRTHTTADDDFPALSQRIIFSQH